MPIVIGRAEERSSFEGTGLIFGCGGLSLGFIQAGCNVVKAVEFDSTITETYMLNHPAVEVFVEDISRLVQNDIFNRGEADIIIGGPPCQGFSMAGATSNISTSLRKLSRKLLLWKMSKA